MFELTYHGATYAIPLRRLAYVVIKPDGLFGVFFPWRATWCVLEIVIRDIHLKFPTPRREAEVSYRQIWEAYTSMLGVA